MSLTLLIADDEGIERRALKMQLERTFPQITLLKPAENGLELVDSVREHRPDIVLADIEMPGMNGLDALEQLRQEGITPYVIIMTAYSSERYLKESLSLRVFAYLEKPIRRDEVERMLCALIGEVEAERSRVAELAQMRDAIRAVRRMVCSELMTNIESDEADPNQIHELLAMLELDAQRFLIVTFSLAEAFEDGRLALNRRVMELNAFQALQKCVRDRGWLPGHVLNHRMSCLVPVLTYVENDGYSFRHAICCEVDDVLKTMGEVPGLRAGIGISTTDARLLQKSRQQSIQALYHQDPHAGLCHYEDQPSPLDADDPFIIEEPALIEFIQSGNAVQAEACIHRCFDAVPAWVEIGGLRNQAFELLLALNRRSRRPLFDNLIPGVSEEILRCENRSVLENYIVKTCLDCIDRGHRDDSRWQEDIIEKARQYIDACYNSDISLESTAEAIGVSKFYLSRLFKTQLGKNYSAYLTERRVYMATVLVNANRELNNRDIAEFVGFNDPDYFGKVFKRVMGMTITEYRDANRRRDKL